MQKPSAFRMALRTLVRESQQSLMLNVQSATCESSLLRCLTRNRVIGKALQDEETAILLCR